AAFARLLGRRRAARCGKLGVVDAGCVLKHGQNLVRLGIGLARHRQAALHAQSERRQLVLEFTGQRLLLLLLFIRVVFRLPERHPDGADLKVVENLGRTTEADDVVLMPVGNDDQRQLLLRLFRHVSDGRLDRSDVALLRLAWGYAAVDQDVLWPVVRGHGHEEKIAKADAIHTYPQLSFFRFALFRGHVHMPPCSILKLIWKRFRSLLPSRPRCSPMRRWRSSRWGLRFFEIT